MKKSIISIILIFSIIFSVCSITVGAAVDYGKSTINDADVNHVYEAIYAGVVKETPDESINFSSSKTINMQEVRKAVQLFIGDHPECFWFVNSYTPYGMSEENVTRIEPKYAFEGNALTKAREAMEQAVNGIMEGLPTTSNYDKALYLHDALAKRVTYKEAGEHQTAYGALVLGEAVCMGYAMAYQLLLEKAGMNSWTVTGESRGIPHAWNVVWLDSSTCVYTDVTWDDQGDNIFHYYFNLSKSEMAEDHIIDTDIFTLPSCNHADESYFDVNHKMVDDSTSAVTVAAMFGDTVENSRSADICYTGSDFSAWMNRNGSALYSALGGNGGNPTFYISSLGKEIKLTINGNFPKMTYKVAITAGAGMRTYSSTTQYVEIGEQMSDVVFTANEGYYFPDTYRVSSVRGVSVTRLDSKRIRVSGTPTADNVSISLPAASVMQKESTPTALFTATGDDSGVVSGVQSGMKYSLDGTNWYDIQSGNDIQLADLDKDDVIYIVKKGNGESTTDSYAQSLRVGKAEKPSLTATQPTQEGGKGSINTSDAHEYSIDGENWIDCGGELTELDEGSYYVRTKASGSTLASEAQKITIVYEQVQTPSDDENVDGEGEPVAPPEIDDDSQSGADDSQNQNNAADGENSSSNDQDGDQEPESDKTDSVGGEAPIIEMMGGCGSMLESAGTLAVVMLLTLGFAFVGGAKKKQKDQ